MDVDIETRQASGLPGHGVLRREQVPPLRFYDTLLDALSALGQGVCVLEGEFFLYANPALTQMLGYDVREIVRPGFSVRQLIAPEEASHMDERLGQRFSGKKREDHYETTLVRRDGARVDVEISVKPLGHGETTLRFAVLRDITARRRTQAELQRAREDTAKSEKLAALGSLVSGVAHEVRTPLVYIQNGAATLRRRVEGVVSGSADLQTQAEAMGAIQEIEEGVERINRLVRDLSRYTRLPVNRMDPTPLDEVIRDALRLWSATHPGGNIEIVHALEPTAMLRLDRGKVQQLVFNLLQNATEAMPTGGRVTVRTQPLPQGAALSVSDQGMGIPKDIRARMFEPLFTTKDEGMGLGLSIVRRIVELHKGTITCQSSVGVGTTFLVTFPG